MDIGLAGAPVCSCMGSPRYAVKLRAVLTLKKNTLGCCAGLDVHHMHTGVERGGVTQLGFSSFCRKDKKGCRRGERRYLELTRSGRGPRA